MSNARAGRSSVRIASLLPSATDIVSSLGLAPHLVGVTHECDVPADCSDGMPLVLTGSLIDTDKDGQGEIDAKVKEAAAKAAGGACPLPNESTPSSTAAAAAAAAAIQASSLYPINKQELSLANPNVVLTQDLCGVCAPSTGEVRRALEAAATDAATATNSAGKGASKAQNVNGNTVLSLEPESLSDVADTFVAVADACGVRERGEEMKDNFLSDLALLRRTVASATTATRDNGRSKGGDDGSKATKKPRVLLLEWLDPPYDGGHWIPGMIEAAGCDMATISSDSSPSPSSWNGTKSKQVTWDDVYSADPDVVVVACCGFDLSRNIADARAASEKLCKLRAAKEGRIYASDGNLYFARPGPTLLGGANIVAQCAFDGAGDYSNIKSAVQALDFAPEEGVGWAKVDLSQASTDTSSSSSKGRKSIGIKSMTLPSDVIHDIEDTVTGNHFSSVHRAACDAGSMDYIDPETGYHVFTELAHKKRGKCCGSGCRHCPFNHENVRPDMKASKIMQPSFLYEGEGSGLFSVSTDSLAPYERIKILFFSGGKDSFLALRAVVRQRLRDEKDDHRFGLILLTTFDASSRIIAHQEAPIDTVIRQATHLQVPLLGVPMHRGSEETYVERVRRAMDLVGNKFGRDKRLTLVFGDLHLDHIRHWRDDSLGNLNCDLEYPLWQVPYSSLMNDLELAGVVCEISASTRDGVKEGEIFNRELSERVVGHGMDGFGEEGEFHSIAKVWVVDREKALGL